MAKDDQDRNLLTLSHKEKCAHAVEQIGIRE